MESGSRRARARQRVGCYRRRAATRTTTRADLYKRNDVSSRERERGERTRERRGREGAEAGEEERKTAKWRSREAPVCRKECRELLVCLARYKRSGLRFREEQAATTTTTATSTTATRAKTSSVPAETRPRRRLGASSLLTSSPSIVVQPNLRRAEEERPSTRDTGRFPADKYNARRERQRKYACAPRLSS